MKYQLRPFYVSQKAIAKPGPFASTLDKPGNICDNKCPVVPHVDHAQIRFERSKRVIGYLRFRGRYNADQRRFSGVGKSDEPDVRDQFQFKLKFSLLTRPAVVMEFR